MTQERTLRRSFALVAGLLALGCADTTDQAPPAIPNSAQELPAGHVPVPQGDASSAQQAELLVTVLETMDSGGYTYARVEAEGTEAWTAGPPTELAVGDILVLTGATAMENFTSGTLDRTFDLIYFLGAYVKDGGEVGAMEMPADGTQGTVAQVLTGGGYAYVQVEVEGDLMWLAGPMAKVDVGQTVAWRGGTPMPGFTSSTLDRTFDEILFVERISVLR